MDELFIYDRDKGLFKKILEKSKVMQGRYHVSYNQGADLNTNNLETFITDPKYGLSNPEQKYPMVVCMAPYSIIESGLQPWERFYFDLFFLCTTGYTGQNQTKSINKPTGKSEHHIWYDWKDMKEVAVNFVEALRTVLKNNSPLSIGLAPDKDIPIRRLSKFNNDRISGVGISFGIDINATICETADYEAANLEAIDLSTTIIHALHKH